MEPERRKAYTRWHSRTVTTDWIIDPTAMVYRIARGDAPGPGEQFIQATENDLLAGGFEPNPPRDVPPPVYPRHP